MNNILEEINAKQKAISVIDSCNTLQHIVGATNYIKLYRDKFEDSLSYTILKCRLDKREEEIVQHGEKN